jgi:hypothetical protein
VGKGAVARPELREVEEFMVERRSVLAQPHRELGYRKTETVVSL